jgi:hypothetical protein
MNEKKERHLPNFAKPLCECGNPKEVRYLGDWCCSECRAIHERFNPTQRKPRKNGGKP